MRLLHFNLERLFGRVVVTMGTVVVTLGLAPTLWAQEQGQILTANYFGDAVTVYPLPTSGDKEPQYTVLGSTADGPHQIAINHRADELIVANNVAIPYSVAVYDRASGALKRKISGPSTGIVRPTGVAVDEVNGEIYVANDWGRSITVYDALASGDSAPKRTIVSWALLAPVGIAIDLWHNEIVVADYGWHSVVTFDRLADGATEPKRVISGGSLFLPQGIALDLARDEILVANSYFQSADRGAILAFERTAQGWFEAPLRRLEGSSTKLCNPFSVAIDFLRDEIVVANSNFGSGECAPSVTTYARTAEGDVSPKRMIVGELTNLNYPTSAAIFYGSDLSVSNKASSGNVGAGTAAAYTITATAVGGSVLGVVLTDTLPSGLAWTVGGTDASSCLLSGTQLSCSFGDLTKGQSKAVKVSATTSSSNCPGISNEVSVSYNDGTAFLTSAPSFAKITVKCK